MGSASSRPSTSMQTRKGSARKSTPGVFAPSLRLFSCGACRSCNTEGIVEGVSKQVTDISACKNVHGKAVAADLRSKACNPLEERYGNSLYDGASTSQILTSSYQNSQHSCVSEILKIHATTNQGCANAFNDDNTNCLAGSSQDGCWESNEASSIQGEFMPLESEEITRGIAHASCSSVINSQQADLLDSLKLSHSTTSVQSDRQSNSLQSDLMQHSGSGDVSNVVRQPQTVEAAGHSLASEAISVPSEIDNHMQREASVSSFDDADHLETVGILHAESSGVPAQSSGESLSFAPGEASGREARRINRRRLLDVLTRVTSRRRTLFRTFADGSEVYVGRSLEMEERRWRVRPQVLALRHPRNGSEGISGHSRLCASGRHPGGSCFCEEVVTEENNTRASISRIVMLAEALFELLDEIHHQSVALSQSTSSSLISLPAPAAVVEALSLRPYKRTEKVSALEEAAQCYICLIEYEDGDWVRSLPCHHAFHMICVDKWLKEIHRVCPLCRGNVCDTSPGSSVSS